MVKESKITTLKRRRGEIKSKITRFQRFLVNQNDSPDLVEIQVKVEALTEQFKKVYTIHEELMEEDVDGQETHVIELETMEEDYYATLTASRKLIQKAQEAQFTDTNSSRSSTPASNHGQISFSNLHLRLPEIELPKFDGNIEKWQSFRETFQARIDGNRSIPIVDKMHYLQSALTDKAARAIESIETTEANYQVAWDILKAKYDNVRKAILRHWSILHGIPRLQKDTPQALDELIDTIRQHLRALQGLGEPIEHGNSYIIYIILSKISEYTKWEMTLPDNKMPSYTSLIDYLAKRASCSDYSQSTFSFKDQSNKSRRDNKPHGKAQGSPRSQALVTTSHKGPSQSKTNSRDWRHVPTQDNPADLLSRGLLPQDLKKMTIWRKGPAWLAGGEQEWPIQQLGKATDLPEIRKASCLTTTIIDDDILTRFSSFNKLQRIIAFCLRFKKHNRIKGPLTIQELRTASTRIIKLLQKSAFPAEIKCLQNREPVSYKSGLISLNPFIDNDGILRVGGRLQQSNYPYQQKHPAVLPKSHHVTRLIIEQAHKDNLHSGAQATLCAIRERYWPIDGRNQVRRVIRACVRCAKANPPAVDYVMGNLPRTRITEARPFLNVGVDYCGPFYIKERRFRNRNKLKVYVAVFVCLAVKAIHIEVISDLTTEGFLAALRRFISRRGRCASIYSNNGTNFIGANNELKELRDLLNSQQHNDKVHDCLAEKGIAWHFIPPQSPHVGGIWEAAVKSFKHHLKRVVDSEIFTFEQLNTLTTEIEAVLNSRPITPLSSDPNDLTALTPSHFLIGDSLAGLPQQDLSATPINRLSTWQHIQKVKQDFWTRWHKEYINELNIRRKWTRGEHTITEGSVVVIREDNAPPLQWRLGRVIETYPGPDGVIRNVRIKTSTGTLERSVKQIAPLPVNTE